VVFVAVVAVAFNIRLTISSSLASILAERGHVHDADYF